MFPAFRTAYTMTDAGLAYTRCSSLSPALCGTSSTASRPGDAGKGGDVGEGELLRFYDVERGRVDDLSFFDYFSPFC